MNQEELFKAMSELDPQTVEAAEQYTKKAKAKPPIWLKWGALAACAVIILGALFGLPALQYGNPQQVQKGSLNNGGTGTTVTDTSHTSLVPSFTDESDDGTSGEAVSTNTTTTAQSGETTKKPAGTTPTTKGGGWFPTFPSTTKVTTKPTDVIGATTTAKSGGTTQTTTTAKTGNTTQPTGTRSTTATAAPTQPTSKTAASTKSTTVTTATTQSTKPSVKPTGTTKVQPTPSVNYDIPASFKGLKKTLADYPDVSEETAYDHWQRATAARSLQTDILGYYSSVMRYMLSAENENTVCSPLNTYFSFAVLAELAGGNTRQQVLDMLNVSSIESLRSRVTAIWEANYADQSNFQSLLANSVWLKKGVPYSSATLDQLAKSHYASTFIGTPGTAEMNQALRDWTSDNTGHLLDDYVKDMKTRPDMVFEIVSTIYYKAPWQYSFSEKDTKRETFHGTRGDATVDMMHNVEYGDVYLGDNFTAVQLDLRYGGDMIFLLPNKGVNVNALLSDPQLMSVLHKDSSDSRWELRDVHLSLPKFSVSAQSDLIGMLKSFGVTDALSASKSDFTPLTSDRTIALNKAKHAAMVEIDESGLEAAAFTEQEGIEAMAPERIDLRFDRPFLFAVTGVDGSLLFTGVVRNI